MRISAIVSAVVLVMACVAAGCSPRESSSPGAPAGGAGPTGGATPSPMPPASGASR